MRLGNHRNRTNQQTVEFTIREVCDRRCIRRDVSPLLSLWFVLSGSCSLARFHSDFANRRSLRVECRRSWEVLLAILYQRAHDGKFWSWDTSWGENTLEHCVVSEKMNLKKNNLHANAGSCLHT